MAKAAESLSPFFLDTPAKLERWYQAHLAGEQKRVQTVLANPHLPALRREQLERYQTWLDKETTTHGET